MNDTGGSDDATFQWFAVWTRSRQEKTAAAALEALDVTTFLPLKSEIRQWSDRKQTIAVPLFAGYLFVRLKIAAESRLPILRTPGVVGFVGNSTGPLPIPDQQIDGIRRLLESGLNYSVGPLLKAGDRVRVVRGSLTGMEGIFVRSNSETRLILSVDLVKTSLSVSVSRQDVELIGDQAA